MLMVLKKYEPIFQEAEEIAKKVDVSDIQDSFPCGGAHLYLNPAEEHSELGKALKLKNSDYNSLPYKLKLPIKFPVYGQCIAFDEKIGRKVREFLETKGINALIYSWVD